MRHPVLSFGILITVKMIRHLHFESFIIILITIKHQNEMFLQHNIIEQFEKLCNISKKESETVKHLL